MVKNLRDIEHELRLGLNRLYAWDEIDRWTVEYSAASEARYYTAHVGMATYQVRLASHPVQRPGPQLLLGDHAGADSSDPVAAVQAVRQWAKDIRTASAS